MMIIFLDQAVEYLFGIVVSHPCTAGMLCNAHPVIETLLAWAFCCHHFMVWETSFLIYSIVIATLQVCLLNNELLLFQLSKDGHYIKKSGITKSPPSAILITLHLHPWCMLHGPYRKPGFAQ